MASRSCGLELCKSSNEREGLQIAATASHESAWSLADTAEPGETEKTKRSSLQNSLGDLKDCAVKPSRVNLYKPSCTLPVPVKTERVGCMSGLDVLYDTTCPGRRLLHRQLALVRLFHAGDNRRSGGFLLCSGAVAERKDPRIILYIVY